MILDRALAAAGDEDHLLDPGLARLVDRILDQRPVDHRQHFFRHRFSGRKKTCTKSCYRENGFANTLSHNLFFIGCLNSVLRNRFAQ